MQTYRVDISIVAEKTLDDFSEPRRYEGRLFIERDRLSDAVLKALETQTEFFSDYRELLCYTVTEGTALSVVICDRLRPTSKSEPVVSCNRNSITVEFVPSKSKMTEILGDIIALTRETRLKLRELSIQDDPQDGQSTRVKFLLEN